MFLVLVSIHGQVPRGNLLMSLSGHGLCEVFYVYKHVVYSLGNVYVIYFDVAVEQLSFIKDNSILFLY